MYCDLLSRFGSDTIENVTASVGIDVTDKEFWMKSVKTIEEKVDLLEKLIG